jgi:ribosomal protein S12 methylthiotransferase accessory factor
MRVRSQPSIPPKWLPFVGNRLGIVKRLSVLSIDPEDLGLHHVFPSTTSLARLLNDTRQFEPRAGGAGICLSDAVNRAVGELLERFASLAYEGTAKIVSSYSGLECGGVRTVPFEALTLFTREQLLIPGFPYTEFTENTPVGWFEGTDLTSDSPIYVPGQLLSLGYAPSPEEVSTCFYSTSSGCALGTSAEGALLAGLLECIERDAVMMRWYARLAPAMLDLDPKYFLGAMQLPSQRLEIRFHDMTVDGEVPVVGATCIERTGRPCFFILGCAAALDTLAAARKALVEAGQGRPYVKFLGSRDDPPSAADDFTDFDSNVRFFGEPSNGRYAEWFSENTCPSTRHLPVPRESSPAELCRLLLDRCSKMGLTPIAFDMTTPELLDSGLFVCRVFVPELVPLCVPFAPFLGHVRLARYIAESERDGLAASVPAWIPHPFP